MPIKKDNVFMELRFFPNLLLIKKRVLIIMALVNIEKIIEIKER